MKHAFFGKNDALPGATLWEATAPFRAGFDRLQGTIQADVIVVGGGLAGLSTALHLAEAGVDVALIERGEPGCAATGRSGGLIAPDYIRHTPATIGADIGREAGERLTRFLGESARFCFELVDRLDIECDARRDGFVTPAHTNALAQAQQATAEQWRARGFDVRFMEMAEVRHKLGSPRYLGGLHFAEGGALNPLAFARGLARAAERAGAAIFANSPVVGLEQVCGGWKAATPDGAVTARRLVLAANGGNAELHPLMRRTTLPLQVVEFATAPLDADLRARLLAETGGFTDKTPYIFTARYDGQGHLVSAFPASVFARGTGQRSREARRHLQAHFPAIGDPAIAYIWEGTAWINPSFLPEIYDLGDGAHAIQACNGRGLAINSAIGREMATLLTGGDANALALRPRRPAPIRFHRAAALLPSFLMSMAYLSERARLSR